jgi:hypothetical protein
MAATILAITLMSLGALALIVVIIPNTPTKIHLTTLVLNRVPSQGLRKRLARTGMLTRRVWLGAVLILFAAGLIILNPITAKVVGCGLAIIGLGLWINQIQRQKKRV